MANSTSIDIWFYPSISTDSLTDLCQIIANQKILEKSINKSHG